MSQTQSIKAFFMSRPGTKPPARRTWLIRIDGQPSQLVRIHPGAADVAAIVCDCGSSHNSADCEHITAAKAADTRKFK